MRKLSLKLAVFVALAVMTCTSASADQRYIVRTTGGLLSVLKLCASAGCTVQGSLDGNIGQTYLVTSSQNLIANLLNTVGSLLEALLGIQSVEPDQVLPLPQVSQQQVGTGLSDTAPVNYYGSVVWHGYAAQPATYIIRLRDAQGGFGVSGKGVVAVIDTGVDVNHPALVPVLLPGYDFTRNQAGASEWTDVAQLPNGPIDQNSQDQQPVVVQQSTAAVLDQSTAAVLDGSPYDSAAHLEIGGKLPFGRQAGARSELVRPDHGLQPPRDRGGQGRGSVRVWIIDHGVPEHAIPKEPKLPR